jgi:hypothetical protein
MAEKYYNKKPPEFGMIEYSGGLIFVHDIPVFFLLNLLWACQYMGCKAILRAERGEECIFGKY